MTLDIAWVDAAMLVFLLVSVVVGLMRGFVFELLSLAGWFAAYFAGRWLTPAFRQFMPFGEPGSMLKYGATFACIFLVTLVLWSLVARLVRALVRATPLSPIDRLLGAGFGVARGLIVLLIFATLIGVSPLANSAAWQRSQGAAWLQGLLRELWPVLKYETDRYPSA